MQDTANKLVFRGDNVTKLLGVPKRTWSHMIFSLIRFYSS